MGFGQDVRRRRKAAGLSLEGLAERAKLSASNIGSIEAGQRDPSLSSVLAIASGLGVAASDFVGGRGEISAIGMEAARLIEMAPPAMQEAVLSVLRAAGKGRR